MLIYMDLCCFNRPYDDQTYHAIYIKSEAKLIIQTMILKKEVQLIWSYMLEYENSINPNVKIKDSINEWKNLSDMNIIENNMIIQKANEFKSIGLGIKDSIHLSCAIYAKADYFLTTDKGIIKKRPMISDININNPVEFVIDIGGKNEIG